MNRLIERLTRLAGITEQLSSHSFRRGGAQRANGSAELTDRWIFDRGAWNISTADKAFNYVFNTRTEDNKVAKVLSGWGQTQRTPSRSRYLRRRHPRADLSDACSTFRYELATVDCTIWCLSSRARRSHGARAAALPASEARPSRQLRCHARGAMRDRGAMLDRRSSFMVDARLVHPASTRARAPPP